MARVTRRGGEIQTVATTPDSRRPVHSLSLDVLSCPELAFLVAAARDVAWQTHCNVVGLRYHERKDALARLRGALASYDRALAEAAA